MKKQILKTLKILPVIIFLFFIGEINAQSLVYGLNISSLKGKDIKNTTYKPHFFLAYQQNIDLSEKRSDELIGEIAWSYLGANQKQENGKEKLKESGIHVGLLYKHRWGKEEGKGFYVLTGPAFRVFTGGDATIEVEKDGIIEKTDVEFNNFITDWLFGMGYDVNEILGIECRYNLGVQPAIKSYKIYNTAFSINMVCHLYPLF